MTNSFKAILGGSAALLALASFAGAARANVQDLYEDNCAACHGADLTGGLGPNLIDNEWLYGSDTASVTKAIRDGFPDGGMTPFAGVLSDDEIRSLVIYMAEKKRDAEAVDLYKQAGPLNGVVKTKYHTLKVETLLEDGGTFWALEFLPDGAMLITRKDGNLYMARDGNLGAPITGTPEVLDAGQGGLLDVGVHPDYAQNGWIYLSFAHSGSGGAMTKAVRGRIKDGAWVDEETIFEIPSRLYEGTRHHYGTRFDFHDGYVFLGIGDRGRQDKAQDLDKPNGKIYRLYDDGRVPEDNPFANASGALAAIWSYGHRNPQGLARHPETGALYNSEHGPRGGDEINLVEPGKNYGWPVITYGMNYNGTPITGLTEKEGMEQPVWYWVPSIAVCGIDFYQGNGFSEWQNDLIVGGLAAEQVERLRMDGDTLVEREVILKGEGRVRDVKTGPDGAIYLVINTGRNSGSAIKRLVPAK